MISAVAWGANRLARVLTRQHGWYSDDVESDIIHMTLIVLVVEFISTKTGTLSVLQGII